MERTKSAEILTGLLEAHIFADNPHYIGLLLNPFRCGTCFRHFDLGAQFYNRHGLAAAVFRFEGLAFDERMSPEEFP